MLCLEPGRLAAEPTPPCVTECPVPPRPSYAVAPSVSSEATSDAGIPGPRRWRMYCVTVKTKLDNVLRVPELVLDFPPPRELDVPEQLLPI